MSAILLQAGVLLHSCTDKEKIPSGVIPKEKMEKILWDMVQADRFVNGFINKPGDTTDKKKAALEEYAKVFSLHDITQEEFLRSYKFYLGRPDISRNMFDSMYVQANRRKTEALKAPKKDSLKTKADSLRSLKTDSMKTVLDSLRSSRIDSMKALRPDSSIRAQRDSLRFLKLDSLRKKTKP